MSYKAQIMIPSGLGMSEEIQDFVIETVCGILEREI